MCIKKVIYHFYTSDSLADKSMEAVYLSILDFIPTCRIWINRMICKTWYRLMNVAGMIHFQYEVCFI